MFQQSRSTAFLQLAAALLIFLGVFGIKTRKVYADTIYVEGHITIDTTWTTGNVYVVQNFLTVDPNITLTIQPGVIVKIADNKLIGVNGVLKVEGAEGNPVYITSLKDDSVGGDTNGDGGGSFPEPGDWGHIGFFDNSVDGQNLVQHAIIRYGGYFNNGFYIYYPGCFECQYNGPIHLTSASPTIQNSTLEQNYGYAFSGNVNSYPILENNTLSENGGNGLEIRGGTLASGAPAVRHWSNTDLSYALTGFTTIPSGVTLIFDPGVIIKLADNKLIGVDGVLRVEGTTDNPIYITSLKDDSVGGDTNGDGSGSVPEPGDWGHIGFFDNSVDGQNLVQHAIIRYGGYFNNGYYIYYPGCFECQYNGPIHLTSASPTVQNSVLNQNNGYAFSGNVNSYPVLENNTLSENGGNGLEIRGGTLASGIPAIRHWSNIDLAYALTGFTTIPTGVTLVFDPGVIVKIAENKLIGVNGVLKVEGVEGNPVYITSLKDDSVGGDTNGDGGGSIPEPGDWGHIGFFDDSVDGQNLVQHAIIRYGGYFNNGYYIYYPGCFECQYYGAIRFSSASAMLTCNHIYNNGSYGLYNASPTIVIDAENQWWGSMSGPYHASTNPNGVGNGVSDGVDYSPWLQAPCGMTLQSVFLPTVIR